MFEKVLIANRGEVALRIHRACREMGIRTVAVHSEADANAMHVRLADEAVCIGPARSTDSYLNKAAIISAALISGADAIECRINAEDPETFVPCPGKITEWHAPGGLGIRVDSEIYSGYSIPPFYDSMIAKLIVHGKTRNAALMRLRRALEEFVIEGVKTTIPLHQEIISQAEYIDGQYNIHWLEQFMEKKKAAEGK